LDSDVLKIAHHGSKTSSSEDFLKEVSPEIAVISVGKDNSYGHPTQEVLENLNKYGIKVLRTDEAGDIKIISDGQNLKIE
jgi:competence protein ComEC